MVDIRSHNRLLTKNLISIREKLISHYQKGRNYRVGTLMMYCTQYIIHLNLFALYATADPMQNGSQQEIVKQTAERVITFVDLQTFCKKMSCKNTNFQAKYATQKVDGLILPCIYCMTDMLSLCSSLSRLLTKSLILNGKKN